MQRYRMPAILGGLAAVAVLAALLGWSFWATPAGVAQEQQPILEYPEYPPTPTVGANPTPAPALAASELFREDFHNPAARDRLHFVDLANVLDDLRANWVVQDGRLVQDLAGRARNPSTHEVAALVADATYGDVIVRAGFYDEYNGVAGLIARYNGAVATEASYYRYRILKNEYEAEPKQVLEKVVDGVATALVEIKQTGFTPRAWHVLEMQVVGGQITVSLDGVVVVDATDPQPLAAGSAGVYTRALGGLFYDDLIISTP
ncbi:MAG: DUF1080 domain-containing protein [Oscillochloris sp.]|nr:DUF1080 domain-containing protein [Oscillochloris sp.]